MKIGFDMIVNLYDSRAFDATGDCWDRTTPGVDSIRMVAGINEPLDYIFRRLKAELNMLPQSIWLLRIIAHGNSGYIGLGGDSIRIANAHQFLDLRNYFTSNGVGVAFHSCASASNTSICNPDPSWLQKKLGQTCSYPLIDGTVAIGHNQGVLSRQGIRHAEVISVTGGGRGVDFLRRVSRACDITVRGGVHSQTLDSRFRFEGPSIAVSKRDQAVIVPELRHLAFDTTRIFT